MAVPRNLPCLVCVASAALWLPVAAQVLPQSAATAKSVPDNPPRGVWLPGGRSYLGLNLGRSRYGMACGGSTLLCDDSERPTHFYTGSMIGQSWGVEVGYLNMPRIARADGQARGAQGLNLSLVGKAQVGRSLSVFGKLGTTYGRSDTSVLGASSGALPGEQGFGLSYGGGLSLDFTPRLSATLEWDSNDFRFAGGTREPVRSTSLGLQYRY